MNQLTSIYNPILNYNHEGFITLITRTSCLPSRWENMTRNTSGTSVKKTLADTKICKTMSDSNKISATLTDADKVIIKSKLDEIAALMPFLISLNKVLRKKLRKMGPKSVEYVNLCLQGALNFPAAMTVGFNTPEFKKDAALIAQILEIQVKMTGIMEQVNDTLMAVGSDAMIEADEVYGNLKLAAKRDTSAKTLVDEIAKRFKGQGKKKKPVVPPLP